MKQHQHQLTPESTPTLSSWFVAAEQGNAPVLRKLLARGAKINAVNDQGITALDITLRKGHVDASALLKQYVGVLKHIAPKPRPVLKRDETHVPCPLIVKPVPLCHKGHVDPIHQPLSPMPSLSPERGVRLKKTNQQEMEINTQKIRQCLLDLKKNQEEKRIALLYVQKNTPHVALRMKP